MGFINGYRNISYLIIIINIIGDTLNTGKHIRLQIELNFKPRQWNVAAQMLLILPSSDVLAIDNDLGPLLLTWFNLNPSMNK